MPRPDERREGEPLKSYQRRMDWLALPAPRPKWNEFAEIAGVSPVSIKRDASRWSWIAIADEYDRASRPDNTVITYAEIHEWHARDLRETRAVLRESVRQLARAIRDGKASPSVLANAVRALDGVLSRHEEFLFPAGAPPEDYGLPDDETPVDALDRVLAEMLPDYEAEAS